MYLLDTHALLWYLNDNKSLPQKTTKLINEAEDIFVSIASLWEIAIKQGLGKLDIDYSIKDIASLCNDKSITVLGIHPEELDVLKSLPNIHNDPFDRLIIAQSLVNDLILITKDSKIQMYDCIKTIWLS